MSEDLYEKNLWGKVDYLHERYNREFNHISNFLDMMVKFHNACFEFSKTITNVLNKNYILSESNTSTIYKSMENYYKCLSIHAKAFKDTFESIKINILSVTKSLTESMQKEKEMYSSYCKIRTTYNNNKASLDKIEKEFNQRGKECENLVYIAKRAKLFATAPHDQVVKMEAKATENLANTALFEDKYFNAVNEANKSRENEIKTQKALQSFYHNIDIDYYGKVKMMTGFFISSLNRMYNSINAEIKSLDEKCNGINIEDDINEFIEKYKVDTKPDEVIKFNPYKPSPEIVNDSIFSPNVKDCKDKDLEISFEVIKVFRKIFRQIRTDLNIDEERRKNRLRVLANKIFRTGKNNFLTDKEKQELFLYLKLPVYRNYYMIILSKQRTKGFEKNEKLINDLIEIFSYILELAEKEKDYDSTINCIILSQTFYCEVINKETNKKEKKYLVEGIKNNKWLNNIEFWEGIIKLMIEREIKKNEAFNQNKDEKENKSNINNAVFSQLFSFSSNMMEFNINKKDIKNIVEKFGKQYELEKEMLDSVLDNINSKEKPEEKIEDKKEENKEDKKEEKKENDKKEETKEDKKEENKEDKKENDKEEKNVNKKEKKNEDDGEQTEPKNEN